MDNKQDKFVNRKLFIPLNIRDASLYVAKGRNIDKTVTLTMVLVGIAIATFLLTSKDFMDITGFNILATICIYIFVFSFIIYYITAKFIFKIDDKMKARSLEGSEIFDINLGKVWRIRAGSIKVKSLTSGECCIMNYDGRPAFIFKRVNTSVEGTFENADAAHYRGLQKTLDTIVSTGASVSKINIKYNTKNDNVWDYESRRLYHSEHGDTYVKVMKELIEHRYMFTERFSNVSSKYYVVLCKPNTSVTDINNLYETIKKELRYTCSVPSLVRLEELQSLMVQYYGLNTIDLNNMVPVTANVENYGDSKLLDFINPDGTIDVERLPHLKIPDIGVYSTLTSQRGSELAVSIIDSDDLENMPLQDLVDNDIFNQTYM